MQTTIENRASKTQERINWLVNNQALWYGVDPKNPKQIKPIVDKMVEAGLYRIAYGASVGVAKMIIRIRGGKISYNGNA